VFKRNVFKAVAAVVAASAVGILAAPAQPAQAYRRTCGYVSCTVYLNKSETSDFKDGYGLTAIGVAFIPGFGTLTAAGMGLNVGLMSIMLNHGYCVKLKANAVSRSVEQGFYRC
jgi:hypothetical protein